MPVSIPDSLIPNRTDCPLDARARINSLSDVSSIEVPYIGMVFFCKADSRFYVVNSLKGRSVGGRVIPDGMIDSYSEYTQNRATVSVGSVTSLPYGSEPTVTNSGTQKDAVFNFGIPKGQDGNVEFNELTQEQKNQLKGNPGDPNNLTIGTVNTVPYGTPAGANISGTSPNQVLNLTIPSGAPGAPGAPGGRGSDGLSAFRMWQMEEGNEGKTYEQYKESLRGYSAYDVYVANGGRLSESDFVRYLGGALLPLEEVTHSVGSVMVVPGKAYHVTGDGSSRTISPQGTSGYYGESILLIDSAITSVNVNATRTAGQFVVGSSNILAIKFFGTSTYAYWIDSI